MYKNFARSKVQFSIHACMNDFLILQVNIILATGKINEILCSSRKYIPGQGIKWKVYKIKKKVCMNKEKGANIEQLKKLNKNIRNGRR